MVRLQRVEQLRIEIEGATDEELARGLAAAKAVFASAGVGPLACAVALFKLEGEQEQLTEDDGWLADLWIEADEAAAKACCKGWASPTNTANLELVRERKPLTIPE